MLREALDLVGLRVSKFTFKQQLEDEAAWEGVFDDTLLIEEKRVLMQLVDEGLRQHRWIRLEMEEKLGETGRWNKFVRLNKEKIQKEIEKLL